MKDLSHSSSGLRVPEAEPAVSNEQYPHIPNDLLSLPLVLRNRVRFFEDGPTAMLVCGSGGQIVYVNTRSWRCLGTHVRN